MPTRPRRLIPHCRSLFAVKDTGHVAEFFDQTTRRNRINVPEAGNSPSVAMRDVGTEGPKGQ